VLKARDLGLLTAPGAAPPPQGGKPQQTQAPASPQQQRPRATPAPAQPRPSATPRTRSTPVARQ